MHGKLLINEEKNEHKELDATNYQKWCNTTISEGPEPAKISIRNESTN